MSTRPPDAPAKALSLGPLAQVIGFHLAQATVVSARHFERHIGRPFDLGKVEFSLLMLLLANGPLAPKQLAQALSVTPPKLTLLLAGMQTRGWLARERHPSDGRSQHIVLTAKGRQLAQRSAAAAVAMERELASRLSAAEHAMLIELLCKAAGRPTSEPAAPT